MDDYFYESFSVFLDKHYHCSYNIKSRSDLRNYIKKISDNFDSFALDIFVNETRNFIFSLDCYFNTEEEAYFKSKEVDSLWLTDEPNVDIYSYDPNPIKSIAFDKANTFSERVKIVESNNITIIKNDGFNNILNFSIFLEDINNNYIVLMRNQNINNNVSPIAQAPMVAAPNHYYFRFNSELSKDVLLDVKAYLIRKHLLADTSDDNWLYWLKNSDFNNPTILIWSDTPTMLVNCFSLLKSKFYRKVLKSAFGIEVPSPTIRNFKKTGIYRDLIRLLPVD